MISVIILTKNEEADLPACLTSLAGFDDVHILDSFSTDRTQEIAKNFGAKVWEKTFESFGKQRNYALENLAIKYEWILFLDADEQATPEFEVRNKRNNQERFRRSSWIFLLLENDTERNVVKTL